MVRTNPDAQAARRKLAKKYDDETASTEDLAGFAKRAGLKNTRMNLKNLADQKRTFAATARRMMGE